MTYTPPFPQPGTDIIDSRDVIYHVEDLTDQLDNAESDDERDEIREQLAPLLALVEEGEGLEDWEYGVALIEDAYFEEYARDFAEDIGAISGDERWPCTHIDWEAAARDLQMDYTPVEYDGRTYWAR